MKLRPLIPILIIAAGVLAYHNSFQGPFIFDDLDNILENPTIRHLWPLWKALSPPSASLVGGRPVMNLSLALNHAAGGTRVWGYHAFNLSVHILAALTLYGVLRRTLLRPALRERLGAAADGVALAVALIWEVHPLQTEAVTYISQRCESLMGLFYLLTLYAFIRGTESRKRALLWFTLSIITCFLGMATKEVMVTAPMMVLLYDRTFVSGNYREAWTRHWGLYLALASSWLLLAHSMAGLQSRSVGYGMGVTWWGYALAECPTIVQYLRLAVWPAPLVFDYGKYVLPTSLAPVTPYALILAVVATGVLFALKRLPVIGFVGAWFFMILAPTSSVVPVAGSPVAEHRMYLPLASVVTLAVVAAFTAGRRFFNRQQGLVLESVACACVALLFISLTIQRNWDYNSARTIWQDTVQKAPYNPRAYCNLGIALVHTGKVQEAVSQYEQALRLAPDYIEVHYNLAIALARQGRLQEAMAHWEQALRSKPDYAEAHNNLGVALMRLGRMQEAIDHYQQALRIKPDYAACHDNFGLALLQMGKPQAALAEFEQALQIEPDYSEAHYDLALALEQAGKPREAIRQYEEVLRIKPDNIGTQNNLAWLLATHAPEDGGDAVRGLGLAQHVCELTGNRAAAYLDTLAAAYAATGQFSNAVATAQQAIDLARAAGQPQIVKEIGPRLELYRSGRAYRQSVSASDPPDL